MTPKGGQPGQVIEGELEKSTIDSLVASVDTFRRTLAKAMSSEDFWPIFLLLAAGVFLADIFIRRVTVHFYWVMPAVAYAYRRAVGQPQEEVPGRAAPAAPQPQGSRQQSDRRAAGGRPVRAGGRRRRSAAGLRAGALRRQRWRLAQQAPRPTAPTQASLPQSEQDTYTERLLAAKKKAKGKGQ
jgi:hypothetical protein